VLELKVDDSIYRIRIFESYLKIVIKYQGKYYTVRVSCKNKLIQWEANEKNISTAARNYIDKIVKLRAFI
jgi:hypothetical protein